MAIFSGFSQLKNGGSFHSYVSLPEGIYIYICTNIHIYHTCIHMYIHTIIHLISFNNLIYNNNNNNNNNKNNNNDNNNSNKIIIINNK